jgi:hypothetical protein
MKRKQIYIEADQERRLKELAQQRGVAEAVLIREAVEAYLGTRGEAMKGFSSMGDHPIWSIVGIGRSPDAPTDGAVNHDHYLYGAPKDEE